MRTWKINKLLTEDTIVNDENGYLTIFKMTEHRESLIKAIVLGDDVVVYTEDDNNIQNYSLIYKTRSSMSRDGMIILRNEIEFQGIVNKENSACYYASHSIPYFLGRRMLGAEIFNITREKKDKRIYAKLD